MKDGRPVSLQLKALRYVHQCGGGATKRKFIDDHKPIGERLWDDLVSLGLLHHRDDGKVLITDRGMAYLGEWN